MINKAKPNIIYTLNISVVLPAFFKSKKDKDSAYMVNIVRGIAMSPYHRPYNP